MSAGTQENRYDQVFFTRVFSRNVKCYKFRFTCLSFGSRFDTKTWKKGGYNNLEKNDFHGPKNKKMSAPRTVKWALDDFENCRPSDVRQFFRLFLHFFFVICFVFKFIQSESSLLIRKKRTVRTFLTRNWAIVVCFWQTNLLNMG